LGEPIDSERPVGSVGSESLPIAASQTNDLKLSLLSEELAVTKEEVETGRLRLVKRTQTRDATVDENLFRERAEIETVPIGRQIFEIPPIRQEGETTIVPIVEEVIYLERRLMLKEELRVTRRRVMEHFHDTVTLRYQEAAVSRVHGPTDQADASSDDETGSTDVKE
jgi:uncharacterized protein (TIGR02271 family)